MAEIDDIMNEPSEAQKRIIELNKQKKEAEDKVMEKYAGALEGLK